MTRTPEPAPQDNAEIVERAYRMAYAPLRSAQHALDIIAGSKRSERELAREESARLEIAIRALATPIQGEI